MNPNHDENAKTNNLTAGIAYDQLLRCVHCGLCTSSCPTYLETGDENNGPRGRIQLIRMVADKQTELTGRMERHLELCLDCRACESACPSGVQYGRLIEPFRRAIEERDTRVEKHWDLFRSWVLLGLFPHADRLRRVLGPMRLMQRLGLMTAVERLGLLRILPGRLGRLAAMLPPPARPGPRLPKFLPAVGRRRARVAFFVGCVADAMFRPVHWATVRVLQQNGCDVFVPPGQECCGAIHLHNGESPEARRMADANLRAFELDRYDAVIVNHGGCGAMLKEYGLHWRDGLQPHRGPLRRESEGRSRVSRCLGDCALRRPHRGRGNLSRLLPSGRRSAGGRGRGGCWRRFRGLSFGTCRRPASAAARRARTTLPSLKCPIASPAASWTISSAPARIVLTANAGCLLQIEREARQRRLPLRIMHPMEVMDLSYRREKLG